MILHPSCQLVRSRHPVLDIYRATLPDADPLEFVAPAADGVRLFLQATATRISFRGLDTDEFRFLGALRAGRAVGAACPRASFDVHAAIARLAASGAVVGYAMRKTEAA